MNVPDSLRWTLLYRLLATGAFLVGSLLIVGGIVVGFSLSIPTLLADPTAVGDALAVTNPLATIAMVVLGLLVWQVGKSYALFVTLPTATGEAAADGVDTERLKSEILEVLDDRLAEIEDDVAETRRSVQELKRAEHADSLQPNAVDASPSTGTDRNDGAEAAAGSQGVDRGSNARKQ